LPCRQSVLAATLVVALLLVPAGAAAAEVVPGKDGRPRPAGPLAPAHLPTPVPCDDPVQELVLAPLQQYSFADTTAGASAVASYACQPAWDESGPEHVYVLTAGEDLIVDAWLAGNDPDLDLIVLSACDTEDCLAQANTEISAQLATGETVYLVVDGYLGAAGAYELSLETRAVGIPGAICDGGATPVTISGAVSEPTSGNLFDAPNQVSIYDCSPLAVIGGETWYELAFAPADTDTVGTGFGEHLSLLVEATPLATTLDVALWLFDGCGPDAHCLAFVDGANAGGVESLQWENTAAENLTVYLAVDCLQPPAEELSGAFSLLFDASVAVQVRSLSDLRRLLEGR